MAETQEAQNSEQDLSEGRLEDQDQPQYVNTPLSRSVGANQPQDEGHEQQTGSDTTNTTGQTNE